MNSTKTKTKISKDYKKKIWIFIKTMDHVAEDKKIRWKEYKKRCWDITNKQPLDLLENIKRRGFMDMHLDHKISIWFGFKNGIDPEDIGNIANLRMIPFAENMSKGKKCL